MLANLSNKKALAEGKEGAVKSGADKKNTTMEKLMAMRDALAAKNMASGGASLNLTKTLDPAKVDMTKLVSVWIDLQNAVNCYMDSAKDPNPLNKDGKAGIRQLLERKEGLFRTNMMGKRVNYCCRSVISPDPYIGCDEIGIPVHFAKTLVRGCVCTLLA